MDPAKVLPLLLGVAVLAPLASFFIILVCGPRLGKNGQSAASVSIIAILISAVCSFLSFGIWCTHHWPVATAHHEAHEEGHEPKAAHEHANAPGPAATLVNFKEEAHGAAEHAKVALGEDEKHEGAEHGEHHAQPVPPSYSGLYYTLGNFGKLTLNIGYYIDTLTVVMFCMVTLIASCIHFYASGYMHDELHDFEDHEVPAPPKRDDHGHESHGHSHDDHGHAAAHGSHGGHDSHGHEAHGHDDHGHGHGHSGKYLVRPGRYHRFFQALSLFCFSMLGLVLAGNIAMVFVFWELVGICSYFLIGFYVERQSASTAANKAFITNRVGDFGMIIGLMALWSALGTFTFGDTTEVNAEGHPEVVQQGLFSLVRPGPDHKLIVPDGFVLAASQAKVAHIVKDHPGDFAAAKSEIAAEIDDWRDGKGEHVDAAGNTVPDKARPGYWLLVVAGIGIFYGCVGKSAQFPLHVWLPDAMEGPTPVSALVHSATMVAAGVYLVGRFYPVFAPEVLLVIAITGCITLFMAATIAITATDIKRVLAYSTVSQLGYMMLALGVGGWAAGMMHLVTHAFFKSLMFLCSGSVIHAVHTNEMPQMGGLLKKMPVTAYTMLIGCLAIAGAGIPFVIGFSGYYSKDAILEQAYSHWNVNGPYGAVFFLAAAGGAAITAFYMFRLWFMTFWGEPRDRDRYDHAHESPPVMYVPLIVLAVFAVGVAWSPPEWSPVQYPTLANLLEQARPAGTLGGFAMGDGMVNMAWPNEHDSHAWSIKFGVTLLAFSTALAGISLAAAFYALKWLDPAEVKQQFQPIYTFLRNKWYFDELYDLVFIRPTLWLSKVFSAIDRQIIDRFLDGLAWFVRAFARVWDRVADGFIVDGLANLTAAWMYSLGVSLHRVQTGKLRQYVMFIVLGTIALFVLISFFWRTSQAG